MPLLLAAFFLEIGFVLLVVPWSSYWDRNFFSQAWPPLHALLTSNYVRGAISGLGLVNVLAAVTQIADLFDGRPESGKLTPPPAPAPPAPPAGPPQ
jgi:hypothetical protein